jgi:AraC-like DNA-binding protein
MIGFPFVIVTISFFTILILLTKKPRFTFDLIFAVLIFSIGFQHIYHILLINGVYTTFLPLRSGAYPLLFGPLLYLYFNFLSTESAKFKMIYFLQFLPFLLLFTLEGFVGDIPLNETPIFTTDPKFPLSNLIYLITIFLSVLLYSIILKYKIDKHKEYTINYFSNLSIWKNLSWIDWILGLYIVSNLLIPVLHIIYDDNSSFYFVILRGVILFLFVTGLSFFGIHQTIIFTHWKHFAPFTIENENISHIKSKELFTLEEKDSQKYKNSRLSEKTITTMITVIQTYMENKKPFLDPDFTIEVMSNDLDISIHKLSQCLNAGMNTTFNSFVNEKRIEEIKLEIQKNKSEKINFLNLAFSKGFNSKSTFNITFKNLTGLTPSQYQKQISSEN